MHGTSVLTCATRRKERSRALSQIRGGNENDLALHPTNLREKKKGQSASAEKGGKNKFDAHFKLAC